MPDSKGRPNAVVMRQVKAKSVSPSSRKATSKGTTSQNRAAKAVRTSSRKAQPAVRTSSRKAQKAR